MNSIAVLLVCSLALSVQGIADPTQSCTNTRVIFGNLFKLGPNGDQVGLEGGLFDTPQPVSRNTCGLSQTCCSVTAEGSFKDYIGNFYRDKLLTKLSDRLMVCHTHPFMNEYKTFLEASKNNLVSLMLGTYGNFFAPYSTIFDKFYTYLQTIVDTGDTCNIEKEWFEVFYEVYLASILAHPSTVSGSQLPQTDEFRECFYNFFHDREGPTVQIYLRAFLRTNNHTMRYFRALRTLDMVIQSIVAYEMEAECKKSVMKMTHCSSCAGFSQPTCDGMCLNVLRGCLVDFTDLFEPLQEFGDALSEVQTQLSMENGLYYLWGLVSQLNNNFFSLVSKTSASATSLESQVLQQCAPGHVGKRSAPVSQSQRVSRSVATPSVSLSKSASCITDALNLVKTIPEAICESESTANNNCWNGKVVGSYGRAVIDFDKDLQLENPEMEINRNRRSRFQQEIANLRAATRELQIITGDYECEMDDEDETCTVPDICNYYNITNIPIPAFEASGSGSTSTSGTESTPTMPTDPPTSKSTTPPQTTVTQDIPGPGTDDDIVTGSFPGPGGHTTDRVTDDGDFGGHHGGSPALLPGVTVVLISLLSLLL